MLHKNVSCCTGVNVAVWHPEPGSTREQAEHVADVWSAGINLVLPGFNLPMNGDGNAGTSQKAAPPKYKFSFFG